MSLPSRRRDAGRALPGAYNDIDQVMENQNQPSVVIDVSVLAEWLEGSNPGALWTVDGDESLAESISLPARGDDLGATLRFRGGEVRVFAPADAIAKWTKAEKKDLGLLTQTRDLGDGDEPAFYLAWADDEESPSWAIVRDVLAERALAATPA